MPFLAADDEFAKSNGWGAKMRRHHLSLAQPRQANLLIFQLLTVCRIRRVDASTAHKVHIFYGTLPPLSDEQGRERWLHGPDLGYNPRPFLNQSSGDFP